MRKLSSVLVALGAALLLGALGLTVFNLRQSNAAGENAAQTVSALKATIPTDGDFYAKEQPETETPDYRLNPEMEMPTVRIDDREYIGVLSIPALGRELPVISSWDYPGLRVAPCRYTGSAYTDDLVIAAHNYASHFGRLRELSQGDSIRFTDTDGNVFDYVVSELEILEPYAVSQMTESDWDLTLFTCTPGGQYRVTLRCNRI